MRIRKKCSTDCVKGLFATLEKCEQRALLVITPSYRNTFSRPPPRKRGGGRGDPRDRPGFGRIQDSPLKIPRALRGGNLVRLRLRRASVYYGPVIFVFYISLFFVGATLCGRLFPKLWRGHLACTSRRGDRPVALTGLHHNKRAATEGRPYGNPQSPESGE